MGGPLVVVPVSAIDRWGGCTEGGVIVGGTDTPDDYDRACDVDGWAEVIDVGNDGAQALVLGDEPATTCYLPERRAFLRWSAADSDAELLAGAAALLDDPHTVWDDCGVWETDGPAVLMDSAGAGDDLGTEYPGTNSVPEQAPIPIAAGRWRIRACHKSGDSPWVGLVQLLPEGNAAGDGC